MKKLKKAILGAVARGWCSEKNEHKEMDVDLANAIVDEVLKVLKPILKDSNHD